MVEIEIFMADQPPRKRPWYSFSLRAFLLAILLIAIALGVLVRKIRYEQQKATIYSLRSDGLEIGYHRESRLPWWRYLLTSAQLTDDVRSFLLYSGSLNESDLNSLRMFHRLESLRLNDSTSDITPLAGLTQLKKFVLSKTNVTDISALANLTQLKLLVIREAPLLDITPLAGLTQLKELVLSKTNVTDISALANMTQLEKLVIREAPISDIAPLAGMTQLKELNLRNTDVTDLTPLAKLTNVEIYVNDLNKLTVPVELQGRVHGIQ